MKRILSIFLVLALLFSLAACGSKKNADVEVIRNDTDSSEQGENAITEINILSYYYFSNGFAWVKHRNAEGVKTYSLINKSGKIIYSNDKITLTSDMGDDACFIREGEDENSVYKIISKSGKEVVSSESGAFDTISAYGDGVFLVYKDASGIDASKYMLGTIDSKGNFVNELRECSLITTNLRNQIAKYLGDGIFGYTWGSCALYYNTNTNKSFFINGVKELPESSINNKLYFRLGTEIAYESDPNNFIPINETCFSVSSNGTVERANDYRNFINNMLVTNDSDNSTLTLTDPGVNKTSVFTKYAVSKIAPADNNFLLRVTGKDGNNYFILIDKNCNILLDPIQANSAQANDGKIVFVRGDTFSVIDFSGNTLFETSEYYNLSSFHDGIAWAEKKTSDNTSRYYGIDSSGNVVIS